MRGRLQNQICAGTFAFNSPGGLADKVALGLHGRGRFQQKRRAAIVDAAQQRVAPRCYASVRRPQGRQKQPCADLQRVARAGNA